MATPMELSVDRGILVSPPNLNDSHDHGVAKRGSEDSADTNGTPAKKKKQIRIWCDGCFDLMHYGHANALRQASLCGDYLIVGVHSDADILKNKGPPVMNEQERYAAVRACKWVNEVVEGAPYVTQLDVINKYNVDFVVHGDDIVTDANGVDTYYQVKQAGKFKTIKRTQGVSTTDLVGRMLLMTKDHLPPEAKQASVQPIDVHESKTLKRVQPEPSAPLLSPKSPYTAGNSFLASAYVLGQFAQGNRAPNENDKIVYIDGGFDLFHVGHIEALRIARTFGTYLIVGVHDDAVVNQQKGGNLPIMNLHERTLGVLQCRYTDEVITGAPWHITEAVIRALNISVVCHGTTSDYVEAAGEDPYAEAKRLGIYRAFESPHHGMTTSGIIERILENRAKYSARNQKKEKAEIALVEQEKHRYEEMLHKSGVAAPSAASSSSSSSSSSSAAAAH